MHFVVVIVLLAALGSGESLQTGVGRLVAQRERCRLCMRSGDGSRRAALGFFDTTIKVGDSIVAGSDWNSSSPACAPLFSGPQISQRCSHDGLCGSRRPDGIVRAQAYELRRVYYQGVTNGTVQRVDVESLDAAPPTGCAGFTQYMCLYSQRYHATSGPVVLRPTEVQVVRMRDELTESAWLALPGLFWVWLAYTFFQYGEAKGGAFRGLDARSPERRR